MAQQLLHYNQGCTKTTLSPLIIDRPGTASVGMPPNDFFFYSNNPEEIRGSGQLADYGYWLLKSPTNPRVKGAGRVFIWHQNFLAQQINEALVIYNPNSFDIVVTSFGAGVTNTGDGIAAWYSYFQGGGPVVTVPAGGFGNLFARTVAPDTTGLGGGIYGVVATIKVTDTSLLNIAEAELYDLAWIVNSGGATQQAASVGTQVRGMGTGYNIIVSINQMNVTDALATPQGFEVAANTLSVPDSFHGDDLPYVYDPDPAQGASPLQGCYGATYYNLTWAVKNDDPTAFRTIKLYAGNSGDTSYTNFCIKTGYAPVDGGFGGCNNFRLLPGEYCAFLQDTLPPGAAIAYGFTLVTVGGFNYPLTLCMGAV